MLPVIALVGRPNVGKSTLFNRLTRSRDALVADIPGLTRDRQYGVGKVGSSPYILIDTGGLNDETQGVNPLMQHQVMLAIEDSDHVLFLVDAREEKTAVDELISKRLRRSGKPFTLVVNKSEHCEAAIASSDFHDLSSTPPVAVSASHNQGISELIDSVLSRFPPAILPDNKPELRIAVVGRPNVGKSTLVNRLVGEERVITFDQPGTTRDSIEVPFERDGRRYVLIDTAGIRRRGRIRETVEKFSVVKTLQTIASAHAALLMLDAYEGVTEQDAHLAGHLLDSGRTLVVVVNKWDGLNQDQRKCIKSELQRRLKFLDFAHWHFISALHGSGVGLLLKSIMAAQANAVRDLNTSQLTRILRLAVSAHQPPLLKGRRIKLRYAHQGGKNPPLIVIHGNQTEALPVTYRRYLVRRFRTELGLEGTPLRIELRTGENPFKGRKTIPKYRQVQKKRRLMKRIKRKS